MTTDLLSKARDPLLGQRIDGRYLVERVLGRGGMGVVYEGLHEQLGRQVAIKVLSGGIAGDPVAVKRFLREAQTASQLTHGNIVDVSDLGVLDDGRPYLVMPKVQGVDLATVLVQQGPQTPRRTAELLIGAAAALDLIHAKGFVHRDVKPENLMHVIREDGSETTLLLDFGIVGLVSARQTRLTAEGSVFGTPAYLPPEVIQGAAPDRRADVYALATVAFELMSGRSPFDADSPLKILPMKIMNDAPRMGDVCDIEFPESVEQVIARGLTREPDERWPSAGEFVAALDAAVLDLEIATGEIEPQSRSAALRRSAVAARTLKNLANRPSATGVDPVQLAAAHSERLQAESEQIEELLVTELSPLPPMPPAPPPIGGDPFATSKIERNGGETLSVEFHAARARGRERKALMWVGIGAGAFIVAAGLGLHALFEDSGPAPAAAPPSAEVPQVVKPQAAASPVVEEPVPERAAPPPTAEIPSGVSGADPQPSAASPKPARRAPAGKRAPSEDAVAPKAERPVPAKVAPASMLSANELVQAAARELIQGHLSAAADLYAQATRLDPKSEPAYRGLGLTHERLGNKADAIRAFTRAIALAPNGQNAPMLRTRLAKLQGSQ